MYRVVLISFLVLAAAPAPSRAGGAADPAAIVLNDETELVLERGGRVRETVRRSVHVLAPAGQERYGVLVLGYDAFRKIRRLEGRLLAADGTVLRRLGRGDVEDYPATADYSLYEDNRVQVAQLYHDRYPYTIEWEYELEHEGLLNWPAWRPQQGEEAVLHAALTVEVPADHVLRYRAERLEGEPEVTEQGSRRAYRWSASFPPRPAEAWGPPWYEQVPVLHLATNQFSMAGHPGRLDAWEGLAQWYGTLAEGRDALPAEAQAEVERLVAGVTDPRERARRLYEHLQRTTRYVSVQLGIGGWQPFPATYVHQRRYGDCKALVNYLQALLKAAGVPAYPALIGHGRPDLDPDFPQNAFNHVVLFVPLAGGDLWLEATSQTIPFGALGAGSQDRWALVVTPGGGHLVRTPASTPAENAEHRRITVELKANGAAAVAAAVRYTGIDLQGVRGRLANQPPEEQRRWWTDALGVSATDLDVAFAGLGPGTDPVAITATFSLDRFATLAGSRLFFRPNLLNRWTATPPALAMRTQPVDLGYPFVEADTVRFALPRNYAVEAVPEPVRLQTAFGRYEAAVVVEEGVLTYTRWLEVTRRRLPPEDYDAFRQFTEAIVRADDQQVALRRR